MKIQTLDPEVACLVGLEAAIVFQSIGAWCDANRGKPDREKDGDVWTYMSRREWLEKFPYMGEGSLRSAVKKLLEEDLIKTGNYSEGIYARTTWYTLTSKGWNLWLKQPNPLAETTKPFGQNSQTITTNTKQAILNNITSYSPPWRTSNEGQHDGIDVEAVRPEGKRQTKERKPSHEDNRSSISEYLGSSEYPPDEWAEFCRSELGWSEGHVADTFAIFRDYWRGKRGAAGRKGDWPATWRNWCRREGPERTASQRSGKRGRGADDALSAAFRNVMAERYGGGQS